jgi:hypothetical protein
MMMQMARFARAIERYQRTRQPMRAPSLQQADDDSDF